jgi:hypothetical protein
MKRNLDASVRSSQNFVQAAIHKIQLWLENELEQETSVMKVTALSAGLSTFCLLVYTDFLSWPNIFDGHVTPTLTKSYFLASSNRPIIRFICCQI